MSVYKFEPTEIEAACGVTAMDVADMRFQVAVREFGGGLRRVIFPKDAPPALCGAVTRTVLGHEEYEFSGLNSLGMPIYTERH